MSSTDSAAVNTAIKPEATYTFTLPRKVLEAIQLFQSSDETRFSLCATCLEVKRRNDTDCSVLLVATDGRRIGKIETESHGEELFQGELPEHDVFSIDLSGTKKLPKAKDAKVAAISVFEKHVDISCGKYTYKAKRLENDFKFPNWRQIFVGLDLTPTPEIGFNFKLLAAFGQAAKLLTKSETLRFNLTGTARAIRITLPEAREFEGVLMPTVSEEEKAAIKAEKQQQEEKLGIADLKKGQS